MTTTHPPATPTGRSLRGRNVASLAGAMVTAVCQLGLVLLTSWLLSPDDAGRVFAATSLFLIAAAVLRLGTPTAVVLGISRRSEPAPGLVRQIVRTLIGPVAVAALVVAALGLLAREPLATLAGLDVTTVTILLVALPAAVVLEPLLAVTRGDAHNRHNQCPTIWVERIGRPVAQVVLTVIAIAHPTVFTLVAAWLAPYPLALVAAWLLTSALRPAEILKVVLVVPGAGNDKSNPEYLQPAERRDLQRFAIGRGVTSVMQVAFARLDIVLVAALAGPAEAALYTAATRFVTLCQLVQQTIGTTAEPALGHAIARGTPGAARSLHRWATKWSVALLWPTLLVIAATSPWWLRIFGPTYPDAVPTVLVLAGAMVLATGLGPIETVLNMSGRSAPLIVTNAVALMLMVVIDVVLVPDLHALGAAIGWAVAIAVKNLLATWLARPILTKDAA